MSSQNFTTSQGYTITEDDFCDWYLKKNGIPIAKSKTPYPVLTKALNEKLITFWEALKVADLYQIPRKFIDGSLSELEVK